MNLPQYPSPPGNRNQVVAIITGPNPYTQIGVASPPTGGLVINAADLGLTAIEYATGGVSDNGQYLLIPMFDNNPPKELSSVRCVINLAATGAQAAGGTDLSGRTFRFFAFGY